MKNKDSEFRWWLFAWLVQTHDLCHLWNLLRKHVNCTLFATQMILLIIVLENIVFEIKRNILISKHNIDLMDSQGTLHVVSEGLFFCFICLIIYLLFIHLFFLFFNKNF